MDVEKRAAISSFYREEFLRQIEHLRVAGILDENNPEVADRTRRALTRRLDSVCGCEGFSAVAATLLQSFDTLTGLSALDPRQRH